jgi:prepilin-type N-terminal cleavage/methylation domain-containing protein
MARASDGFTLLELILAIALFSMIVVLTLQNTESSTEKVLDGIRARELRQLADRKLGEILLFEEEFDRFEYDSGDLRDYGEQFEDWRWELSVRTVVVFGSSEQEGASYLFEAPPEDEEEAAPAQDGTPATKGETQELRELILRITAPSEGDASDFVEITMFVPEVDRG